MFGPVVAGAQDAGITTGLVLVVLALFAGTGCGDVGTGDSKAQGGSAFPSQGSKSRLHFCF